MTRDLLTVLRKEALWSRHRVVALLFVLILIPGAFAYTSVFFQHVLPKDAPVAVVDGEGATQADRELLTSTLGLFSKPVHYEDRERARRALARERVYAIAEVPAGIADPNVERVNVTVTVDGDVVPYREPSDALAGVVRGTLNRNLEKRVTVEKVTLGEERTLSSYLLPTFLFIVVLTFAFAYLPYNLAREEAVLDRLRVEASLPTVVAGKLLFFTALLAAPVAVFTAAAAGFGYELRVLAPGALFAYLLTFVALGALAMAVSFATRFSTTGRLANVLALFFFLAFSGLVYPAGFFSPVRREFIRRVPTHYAVIVARSTTLKGATASSFAPELVGLAAFALASLVPLGVAIRYYERRA